MISLEPVTGAEFSTFIDSAVERLARNRVRLEDASFPETFALEKRQIETLLPQGINSVGHFFRNVVTADGDIVGSVWFAIGTPRAREAFLYDIFIKPESRRCGFGSEALQVIEMESRAANCEHLWFNVFAHNRGAIDFYRALDYEVGTLHFFKRIVAG